MSMSVAENGSGARHELLRGLGLSGVGDDPVFDDLVRLAACAGGATMALLLVVDEAGGQRVCASHGCGDVARFGDDAFAARLIDEVNGGAPIGYADFDRDPVGAGGALAAHGVRAVGAVAVGSPLDRATLAALVVCDAQRRAFEVEQLELVAVVARQLEHVLAERMVLQAHAQSMRELQSAQAQVRGVLDASRNFIGVMDLDGRLVDANQTALCAAGVPLHEVVGKPFWETIWWQHSPALQQQLRDAVATAAAGERVAFEATHPAPDGSILHVDFSLSPARDRLGVVQHLIPEGVDVTEARDRARRLAYANEQLEQFTKVASHDLRSPLRGIAQLVGFLRDEDGARMSEVGIEYLDMLAARVRRLDRMLRDLLEHARADHLDGTAELIDTRALALDVVAMLQVPEDFEVVVADDLPQIRAFAAPLRQVLLNLVVNALKHHHGVRGTVRVSARDEGAFVAFSVADDGPGIDPAYHARIFEMFETLRSRDEVDGSGVGLAVIHKVVQRQGGCVDVQSQPGQGATFTFTWPKVPPQPGGR